MKKIFSIILIIFFFNAPVLNGNQIIQSTEGNFYILKKDGTFEQLPKPRDGFTYKIKKKEFLDDSKKKSIFKRIENSSRKKTNSSIR